MSAGQTDDIAGQLERLRATVASLEAAQMGTAENVQALVGVVTTLSDHVLRLCDEAQRALDQLVWRAEG